MKNQTKIQTDFTKLMNCDLPIIAAPMFLVSNQELVIKASELGGVGAFPSLNYRPAAEFRKALAEIKSKTKKPICVNIIVNKSNARRDEDLKIALDLGVEMFITSLGSPKEVIVQGHKIGAKIFCDVTNLEHAKKVEDMGADGVIAVAHGAGGHAGPLSPFALIPWLKREIKIPIVAAGAISDGATMAAALALGASAVSIGTRFIASKEAQVAQEYKQAVVDATPNDIVMTDRVSGTPAAVINTAYVKKMGAELPFFIKMLLKNEATKKYIRPLIYYLGMRSLQNSAENPSWKTVWSAGQSVGGIQSIESCEVIFAKLVNEYQETVRRLPATIDSSRNKSN